MMNDDTFTTATLQLLRLKGRVAAEALAESLGEPAPRVQGLLAVLLRHEEVAQVEDAWRLAPAGRRRLAAGLAAERATVDAAALEHAYEGFDPFNARFKALVTAWQVRDGEPNDHADAAYDRGVVDRVAELHRRWQPLLARLAALAPRLAAYPERFARALDKLVAGDGAWLARPLVDSYHTVWFELHEDLIGLLGRQREAEALAGRAE